MTRDWRALCKPHSSARKQHFLSQTNILIPQKTIINTMPCTGIRHNIHTLTNKIYKFPETATSSPMWWKKIKLNYKYATAFIFSNIHI